jgi:long-chain fatty acid transport protein
LNQNADGRPQSRQGNWSVLNMKLESGKNQHSSPRSRFGACVLLAVALMPGVATAQSFALNEHSTVELGRANSGATVQADDASAAFSNPAAMTQIQRPTYSASLSGISGDAVRFVDGGSVDVVGLPLGPPAKDFLDDGLIPALNVIYPVADRWTLGLAVTAPFGLSTRYPDQWAGRYQAVNSELLTVNINPSVAYKVSDALSVGLGVSAMYADAELSNAVDFGAVCFKVLGPSTCTPLGLDPQAADGRVAVRGDDWGFGFNAGLTWTPVPVVLVGLHYRSEVKQKLSGSAAFTVPDPAKVLTTGGAFTDTGASAKIDLPATLEAGVQWRATDRMTLYADVRWRGWSSVEELRVRFDNAAQADAVDELRYKDATRLAVGLDYRLDNGWILRGGIAHDDTPTRAMYRTARISDDDRNYYALGASWLASDDWQLDFAYNRVEIADHTFDHVGDFSERLRGNYEGAADIVSIGFTWRP